MAATFKQSASCHSGHLRAESVAQSAPVLAFASPDLPTRCERLEFAKGHFGFAKVGSVQAMHRQI